MPYAVAYLVYSGPVGLAGSYPAVRLAPCPRCFRWAVSGAVVLLGLRLMRAVLLPLRFYVLRLGSRFGRGGTHPQNLVLPFYG